MQRRIYGIESEYGITCTADGQRRLSPDEVARYLFRRVVDLDGDGAVDVAVEALFQAADEDSATGGPDPLRGIYPIVARITAEGFERLDESEVAERTDAFLASLGDSYR